jgi:hypothetical protein
MPLLDRPYLEHMGTLSHKSAGGIDLGFFPLKYLHNAIVTSVTIGKIPGDLTSASPPRASAARASVKARVANSRFNQDLKSFFVLSVHRRDPTYDYNHFQQMGWICDVTPGMLEVRD